MNRFRNNFTEGSKALLETIYNEDKDIIEQVDACLADFEIPEDYTPFWITKVERKELSSNTFVECINGKLTAYKNSAKEGIETYVTKDEFDNNPSIREEVAVNLEIIENYDYDFVEFEDSKYIRVMGHNTIPDPRTIIMTKAFQKVMNQRYGNTAYIVTTERGALFVFSATQDPFIVLKDILYSCSCKLDREFEVLLIEENNLINVFKLITY